MYSKIGGDILQYLYNQTLLRRLPIGHPEILLAENELARIEAGRYGELRVLRELEDMPFTAQLITNFECISALSTLHQIDFLLLTSRYVLILEVKNMSGTLHYQSLHHEFHRTKFDGTTDHFRNPFDQAYRHQTMLEHYLAVWDMPLPVTYAVVMTNSNARIDPSFGELPIFHVTHLRKYLRDLDSRFEVTDVDLVHLREKLDGTATVIPPRKRVDASEILPGILCSVCGGIAEYNYGVCVCTVCGRHSRKGIEEAMRDYRMLIDETITNQEFRLFTGIGSVYTASKILSRLGMRSIGTKRGKIYILPDLATYRDEFLISKKGAY